MHVRRHKERGSSRAFASATRRKGLVSNVTGKEKTRLKNEEALDLRIIKAVHCKVRYFRDGPVLGSKKFVNDFCESQRDCFSLKRMDEHEKHADH